MHPATLRTSRTATNVLPQPMNMGGNNHQTPVVDPNDWARRMQEAKARAAEIRERRKGGDSVQSYEPVSSSNNPVQRSTTVVNNSQPQQPPSSSQQQYPNYRSLPSNSIQQQSSQQGPYDTYAQQSLNQHHSVPGMNNNNNNNNNRPGYRGMVVFPEQQQQSLPMGNNGTTNNYGSVNNRLTQPSYQPLVPQAPPSQPTNNNNNNNKSLVMQQEAEDTFYSMLRSDNNAPGNRNNAGNSKTTATVRRPQWNSDFNNEPINNTLPDTTNLPNNAPLSTKQKLALMRGELQQTDISPNVAKDYAGIAPSQSNTGTMKSSSPTKFNNSNNSSGNGTGLGDILGPKQQVVSRTGLKPTVIKKATTTAPTAVAPPVSYGNDDIPIGGGNRNVSYGNDDIPIGGGNRNVSYGNDDEPIGGGGNRGMNSFDAYGPDSVPSSSNPSSMTSPSKQRNMKPVLSHHNDNDQNIPPMDDQTVSNGAPPVRGKLSLLKSKIRTTSAKGIRSDSISSDNDGGMNNLHNNSSNSYYDGNNNNNMNEFASPDNVPTTTYSKNSTGGGRPNVRSAPTIRSNNANSYNNNSNNNSYDDDTMPMNTNQRTNGSSSQSRNNYANMMNDNIPMQQKHSPIQTPGNGNNNNDEMDNNDDTELEPCDICGRKFRPKALDVHSRVCAKVFQNKRKAFDVKSWTVPDEARAMAENKQYTNQPKSKSKKGVSFSANHHNNNTENEPSVGPAKTKWEEKSSQLREAMRAARNYKAAVASGVDPASIPMPVSSTPDPSLIPCPNCGRSFSEQAAERHIPKCSSIKNKPTVLRKGAGIAAGANGRKSILPNNPSSPSQSMTYGSNSNNNRGNYNNSSSSYLPDVPDIPLPTSMKRTNSTNTNTRVSSANNGSSSNRYANVEDMPVGNSNRMSMGGNGMSSSSNRMSMGGGNATMNRTGALNNRGSSGGYARY